METDRIITMIALLLVGRISTASIIMFKRMTHIGISINIYNIMNLIVVLLILVYHYC